MKIIRKPAVLQIVGVSSRTWDRLRKAGKAPGAVQLADRAIGWPEAEVLAWVNARLAERDATDAAEAAPGTRR